MYFYTVKCKNYTKITINVKYKIKNIHRNMQMKSKFLTKRLIVSLIAMLMCSVTWAFDFVVNGLTYTVNTDNPSTVTFNGCLDEYPSGAINIPSNVSYGGVKYTVTVIDNTALYLCEEVTSVTIPNTVTTIGQNAFEGCEGISSIVIPNSVTTLSKQAFLNCSRLESVTISNKLQTLEADVFDGCSSLKSVVIPNSVESIGDNAFYGCSDLLSVSIPSSVKSIGLGAFEGCKNLTVVNIPSSVTSFGNNVFYNCNRLHTVNIFAKSMISYGEKVFSRNASERKIYVPYGCKEVFQKRWAAYADNIVERNEIVDLSNSGDNTEKIADDNGRVVDVLLYDRTLYKDGDWNTICLPFDVDIENSVLAGAIARTLTSASITEDMDLNLTFSAPVSVLEAGKPYLIKWNSGDNISNLEFDDVTIKKDIYVYDNAQSGDSRVRFIGTHQKVEFSENDNVLLLGSNNTLYYPDSHTAIGAQRAYFRIGDDNVSNVRRITSFNFEFGDEATSIDACEAQGEESSWYTIQGVKLGDKPAQNGVYIHNGKKVIIK